MVTLGECRATWHFKMIDYPRVGEYERIWRTFSKYPTLPEAVNALEIGLSKIRTDARQYPEYMYKARHEERYVVEALNFATQSERYACELSAEQLVLPDMEEYE